MALRYRPMQPRDVRECVRIVAKHPVIGPRYGNAIRELGPAWLCLLGSEAMITAVFEESEGTQVTVWAVGVSIIVQDDFLWELKKPPFSWFGPKLAKQIAGGDSPLLSDKQLREANVFVSNLKDDPSSFIA